MHGRQTSCTNKTFNSLQFAVFDGIFELTVDYLRFFFAQLKWSGRIYAYGSEWVNLVFLAMGFTTVLLQWNRNLFWLLL